MSHYYELVLSYSNDKNSKNLLACFIYDKQVFTKEMFIKYKDIIDDDLCINIDIFDKIKKIQIPYIFFKGNYDVDYYLHSACIIKVNNNKKELESFFS